MGKRKKKSESNSPQVEGQSSPVESKSPRVGSKGAEVDGKSPDAGGGVDPFLTLVFGLTVGAIAAVLVLV
jgi:hypothetical protein